MCLFCKTDVAETDEKFWIGLDRPYINLITHRACFRLNKHSLNEILQKEKEFIYEMRKVVYGETLKKKSKRLF